MYFPGLFAAIALLQLCHRRLWQERIKFTAFLLFHPLSGSSPACMYRCMHLWFGAAAGWLEDGCCLDAAGETVVDISTRRLPQVSWCLHVGTRACCAGKPRRPKPHSRRSNVPARRSFYISWFAQRNAGSAGDLMQASAGFSEYRDGGGGGRAGVSDGRVVRRVSPLTSRPVFPAVSGLVGITTGGRDRGRRQGAIVVSAISAALPALGRHCTGSAA